MDGRGVVSRGCSCGLESVLKWNSDQVAIFDDYERGVGNTCVSACPGAGKSTTAIEALNHPPKNLKGDTLLTSFGAQSVADLKSKDPPWDVETRTMNSLGFRAINDTFDGIKVSKNYVYGIITDVLGEPPTDGALKGSFNGFRSRIKALVDFAKNTLTSGTVPLLELADHYDIETAPPEWMRDRLSDMFQCPWEDSIGAITDRILNECMKVSNGDGIDFNDQLWLPVVLNLKLAQFSRILIDELQDVNQTQIELLMRSLAPGGRVFGFGEGSQAIFAFRGAGIGLEPMIKRASMKEMPLSVSYRCARSIVREAQKINPKMMWAPDAPEGSVTTCFTDMLQGRLQLGDTVLSRTNAPLVSLFMHCLGAGTPVAMQGRELGAKLLGFIEDSKSKSADELREYTKTWAADEMTRRLKRNPQADSTPVDDHVGCIEALVADTSSIDVVLSRTKQLLMAPEGAKVLASSTHRAKGLGFHRVYIIENTFPVRAPYWMKFASMKKGDPLKWATQRAAEIMVTATEERNLLYVATTRAKRELIYVRDGVVA